MWFLIFFTPASSTKALKSLLSKAPPWSVSSLVGHPYCVKYSSNNFFAAVAADNELVTYALANLVKWSVTTRTFISFLMSFLPPIVKKSACTSSKGYVATVCAISSILGCCLNLSHLPQVLNMFPYISSHSWPIDSIL